ncbi:hypothetical protein VTP01DRAFT_8756 [Rhizomucor pusillus]|uniref:uncharacterized protein n=1 Tax=Rhizomucor pusillus TaxID=4840 RepID=UPI003743AC87
MDHKLANALYRKIKQRNRGRDSIEADIATRWYQYKTRLDRTMVFEEVFRIVSYPSCNHVFPRDGNAADYLAPITRYVLRFQQRHPLVDPAIETSKTIQRNGDDG